MARTDARATDGLEEAIARCAAFRAAGADITFLEAPRSVEEMVQYCDAVDGPKMANQLTGGLTPVLPPSQLEDIGYSLACLRGAQLSCLLLPIEQRAKIAQTGRVGTEPPVPTLGATEIAVRDVHPPYPRWLQAAYPLDLLNASIVGMRLALDALRQTGAPPPAHSLPFAELQRVVGFDDYYAEEARYRSTPAPSKPPPET